MVKKSKSGCKKRGKIHRHRHKKEKHLSPRKSRRALLTLSSAPNTCQKIAEPALAEPAPTCSAAGGQMDMEQIWRNICAHYDVPEDVTNTWYARIEQHLSDDSPTRAYHNWQEMMQRKHDHLTDCAPSIALAAFFQYYHFDGNRSCVQENCEVFEEFCRDAMIEDEHAKSLVCNLLGRKTPDNEVTWSHDDEANLLQDVDLVVLAAPPEEYKHYTQLLRHEYANLDDESYKMMRVKVLETLLLIPAIYATPEYHEKYEELARANIRNEIRELKQ